MATYTSNYGWTKPSGSDNVDISVLNDNLDDQDSTIHDAFLNMAPPFSESSTYAVDDIVLYGTGLYKCHTAVVTPGSWTGSTNWQVYKLSEGGSGGGTSNYNDLTNKPSINGVELSSNKTAGDLGLQEELTFDNVPTANSTNPVKSGGVYSADEAIRKWTTAEAKSVSGNPITLTDGSVRNAEGLVVTLEPKQSGSGTPSPTNVRPITGYTECNVDALPNADYAPYFEGVKNGTHGFVDLGSLTWTANTAGSYTRFGAIGENVKPAPNNNVNADIICPKYTTDNFDNAYAGRSDKIVAISSSGTINVVDSAYTDATAFKTAMSGVYLIYELATPTTPSYTIQQWIALVNSFNGNDATITFGQTVYGGSVDFKMGKVTVTHASIASYNGESINEPWLSSIDEYVSGTTPTTGAQVVYPLTNPIELTLTPAKLELLKGYNYITTNGATIALDYLPDSLLAEAENYVDAKIPPAPTTDGTYVLTCTVTSGTPAYSWESAT